MKRLLVIGLVSVFTFPWVGFYGYYVLRLIEIHHEVRIQLASLSPEKLACFELSQIAFENALVEAHEIKIDGKLYDIASIEIKDSQVTVHALHDVDEDGLLACLQYVMFKGASDKRPLPATLLDYFGQHFLPSVFVLDMPAWVSFEHLTLYRFTQTSFRPPLASPPPKGRNTALMP